jgi:hypothetical protein
MKKSLLIVLFLSQLNVFSQDNKETIFKRISETMQTFKIDTSAVPKDKISDKIRELRTLKGGFNINEAMEYKIAEAKSKNEISEVEYEKLKIFLTEGNGKKWLDNAIIWIYRNHFTYNEIKQLVKFYKTEAGKKLATDFPILMIESVKSAETIMEQFKEKK